MTVNIEGYKMLRFDAEVERDAFIRFVTDERPSVGILRGFAGGAKPWLVGIAVGDLDILFVEPEKLAAVS